MSQNHENKIDEISLANFTELRWFLLFMGATLFFCIGMFHQYLGIEIGPVDFVMLWWGFSRFVETLILPGLVRLFGCPPSLFRLIEFFTRFKNCKADFTSFVPPVPTSPPRFCLA